MEAHERRLVIMRKRAQLLCVYSGVVMLVALLIGLVVLAGFIPGPHPRASAQTITHQYLGNTTGIRAGLCLFMAGIALLVPWGATIAAQTGRSGLGTPVFTNVQIACVAISTIIGVFSCIAWGVATFRAGTVSPNSTRDFNDLGWIIFIFDWSPLAVWYTAVGLAIFADPGDEPIFPRWAGWLSLWTAALSVPGGLTIFFKTGPLAFNGLLALWVPLGVFAMWIVVMTALCRKAIHREAELALGDGSRAPSPAAVLAAGV